MADKQQLSDQLDLTRKLAAAVAQMAADSKKVADSYELQADKLRGLTKELAGVSTDEAAKQFTSFEQTVAQSSKKMSGSLGIAKSASGALQSKLITLGATLDKKFPKAVSLAVGAVSGLVQGFKNVAAIGQVAGGGISWLMGTVFDLSASILAIPLKIFDGLMGMAQNAGGMNDLRKAIEDVRKEFGALKGPVASTVLDTAKNLKGFKATGLGVYQIFGKLSDRINMMRELAVAMGATFGKLTPEFMDNGGALLAYQKGLGLTNEQMKGMADASIATGVKMSTFLNETTKYALDLGKAFGIDSKIISKDVGKAMQDVAHFGGSTVKEIATASVYARKLGLELDKITGTLNAFETFDSAAENAAKLGQSFGIVVDSFEMMNAQDPAKQVEMLRKQFQAGGVDTANMTRQQLKLLTQTTGLDEATAKLAFSQKNQGMSLADIQKQAGKTEKKTLSQADAMVKLADSIERLVHDGQAMSGGFFDMFIKGFLGGVQSSQSFWKIMMNIRMALRAVYMEGLNLGRFFGQLPAISDFLGGIADFFNPAKFRTLARGVTEAFKGFFTSLTSGDGKASFANLMNDLRLYFFDFFDKETPAGQKMLSGFTQITEMLSKIVVGAITWISSQLTDGMTYVTNLLTGKENLPGIGGVGAAGTGFLAKVLGPILKALEDAWPAFSEAGVKLLRVLGTRVMAFLKAELLPLISPAIPYIAGGLAAVMFGPAVMQSVLSVGTARLTGTVLDTLAGVSKNAAAGAAKASASGGGGLLSKVMGPLLGNPYVAIAAAVAALGVIGVGVSKGVKNLRDKIAKDAGDSSDKTLGAGVAGVVQMLSFGALNDDAAGKLAENFARYSQSFTTVIEKYMGKNFATDVKATIMTHFEALINLGEFFQNLFGGNFGAAAASLGKMLLNLGSAAIMRMKLVFVTLPEKLIDWLVPAFDSLVGWLDSLFQEGKTPSVIDSLVAGISNVGKIVLPLIGDIPGRVLTMFGEKLIPAVFRLMGSLLGALYRIPASILGMLDDGFSKVMPGGKDNVFSTYLIRPMKESFEEMGRLIPYAGKYIGDALAGLVSNVKKLASGKDTNFAGILPDPMKGYADYKAGLKLAADKAGKDAGDAGKQIQDAGKQVSKKADKPEDISGFLQTASATAENITRAKASLSKIDDKSVADIKSSFTHVISMFQDSDTGALAASATKITDSMKTVSDVFDSVRQAGIAFKAMQESMITSTASINKDGIAPALGAVSKMVKAANELNDALSDGNVAKLNVAAKLQNVAKSVGLGGSAQYTINNKGVVVMIDLTVTMKADEVEKVIIQRKSSVIRDRLNAAQYEGSSKPSTIPDNPTAVSPALVGKTG